MKSVLVSCTAALLSLPAAADPLVEKALVFDGVNDFVDIPHDASLSLQTLTVEAWVRIDGDYGFFLNPAVTKGTEQGNYALGVLGNQTLARPGAPTYAHRIATGNVSIGGSTTVSIGEWTHLAATYSGGMLRFYVNGVLERSFSGHPAFLSPIESPKDVFLGRAVFFSRADEFLRGALDEVRIWNVPRTASEIKDSMNCVVNPYTPGLVGNWRFNEAFEAQTVVDSSPLGNHGTRGVASAAANDDPTRILSTALSVVGCPIDPRGAGFWKHQCGDLGFQRIGRPELEGLFGIVAADSDAIPECAPVGCEVFDLQASQNQMRTKAEENFLALRLNVASGRLQAGTPVDLPGLTAATTVAEAIAEIEGTLCDPAAGRPDLEAAKDLAEALGLGAVDMDLIGRRPKLTVEPGERAAVEFGLINMSPRRTRYVLTTEALWPHDASLGPRITLDAGELAVITVMVDVPTFATPGEAMPIRVTATDLFGEVGLDRDAVVTLLVEQPAAAPGLVGSGAGEEQIRDIQRSD